MKSNMTMYEKSDFAKAKVSVMIVILYCAYQSEIFPVPAEIHKYKYWKEFKSWKELL